MIVKLREEMDFKLYRNNGNRIKAIRMLEDFMFETCYGWQKGFKGQWLIECGEDMRCAIDDESFRRQYALVED